MADNKPLTNVITKARKAALGERVAIRDLVEAMGPSSIAAVLLLPALVVVTPISGIPGVSIAGGLMIALIASQIVLGRRTAWLPAFVLDRRLPGDRLRKGLDALRRPARNLDTHIHRRQILPETVQRKALGAIAMLIGLCMPLLEFIPFTSSIAAGVVAIIAVAILVRDGLLALAAIGVFAVSVAGIVWLI